jgi:DNA-directed RNA polymerase I, II, and III subunit RPABC2
MEPEEENEYPDSDVDEDEGVPITVKGAAILGNGEDVNDDSDEEDDEDDGEDEEDEQEGGSQFGGGGEDGDDDGEAAGGARPFAEFDNFSEDEEEEDDDANYLQKFDSVTQQKIISDYHPELKTLNSDEVEILSRIVRDENGNIIDPLHKTLPFITKYEKARILGERAKQIDGGAKPFVEVDASVIDGYLIALKEYEAKAIPFIIQRPLPSGGSEYWKFSDLEILA